MIDQKKILGVIPARGGSKGLPRKNILPLNGKPLLAWTIEMAHDSIYIDRLILSSEDDEIIKTAKNWGCEVPFRRPEELARDESTSNSVIVHALEEISDEYDYVILLQVTSPLIETEDLDQFIQDFHETEFPTGVTVTEVEKGPEWMFYRQESGRLDPIIEWENGSPALRRQDRKSSYVPTGSIYIADTTWFLEHEVFYSKQTFGFILPKERSFDIDDEIDFKVCEFMMKEKE